MLTCFGLCVSIKILFQKANNKRSFKRKITNHSVSLGAYFTILMAIGLLHAYQIRLKEERVDDPLGYGYNQGYNYGTYMGQLPAHLTAQAMPTQMPLYASNQLQGNYPASNLLDNAQMYNMPNYMSTSLANYPAQQEPSSSRGMNYFQRSWNRMSSKRMGNFFNRSSSTYRPNGNLITTEMKPMNAMTFNTSTMRPY